MKTEKFIYKSHNGEHNIAAGLIYNENKNIKGVVQITHGMKEYFFRYREFAEFLVNNGYVVCGNDHVGHGDSLSGESGFMGQGDTCETMVRDMRTLFKIVKNRFPAAPYYIMGHSMGSHVARIYASKWAYEINGLMLSGSGDQDFFGRLMYKGSVSFCNLAIGLLGNDRKIKALETMIFKSFWRKFEPIMNKATWQTGDEAEAQAFVDDPKSDFYFTLGGYKAATDAIAKTSAPKWAKTLPKTMPVLIFSGDMDPAGNFGKGVKLLKDRLVKAGVENVTLNLYEGGRHEMLHEICREEVYGDILSWMKNN